MRDEINQYPSGPSVSAVYQLRIVLLGISPLIWRRLLVHSDSTLADLHFALQIAFNWSDDHLHRFLIHGKHFGIAHIGGLTFRDDPQQLTLASFAFRRREKFHYEYNFHDNWQHLLRLEAILPLETNRSYLKCIGGKHAAPPEDCGGPQAYMQLLDHHRWHQPMEEIFLLADTLSRLAQAKEDDKIRQCIGGLDALQEAVQTIKTYNRFQPDHFDRQRVNQRLQQYAEGN